MALIKSISGFRGTIGGRAGSNLTPLDIVESAAAFGAVVLEQHASPVIVVGRDARISGSMVESLVIQTLLAQGIHVIHAGLSTTPTIEMAVIWEKAQGGIIITASHNPKEWNALKFLDETGAFIAPETGRRMLDLLESGAIQFADVQHLGKCYPGEGYLRRHIDAVLAHPLVDVPLVRRARLKVVVDAVNSTGNLILPELLERLGCDTVFLNDTVDGQFAHNPEPLPEHLVSLSEAVRAHGADLGISVDPDVDRLALISENGTPFGEEYTLVAVADLVLRRRPGNTVSNLSSSRALRDQTLKYGGHHIASAVGEVHVVAAMKANQAVIGGEGNGGIIVPELHYGRDAVAGVALFLTALCQFNGPASAFRASFPHYEMVKDKITLAPNLDMDDLMGYLQQLYAHEPHSTIDGLKVDFATGWVHLRRSNTEPIIRIYAEAGSHSEAAALVDRIKNQVNTKLNETTPRS